MLCARSARLRESHGVRSGKKRGPRGCGEDGAAGFCTRHCGGQQQSQAGNFCSTRLSTAPYRPWASLSWRSAPAASFCIPYTWWRLARPPGTAHVKSRELQARDKVWSGRVLGYGVRGVSGGLVRVLKEDAAFRGVGPSVAYLMLTGLPLTTSSLHAWRSGLPARRSA